MARPQTRMSDERIPALRNTAELDLAVPNPPPSPAFMKSRSPRVKAYQEDQGPHRRGVIGTKTLLSLNITLDDRIDRSWSISTAGAGCPTISAAATCVNARQYSMVFVDGGSRYSRARDRGTPKDPTPEISSVMAVSRPTPTGPSLPRSPARNICRCCAGP